MYYSVILKKSSSKEDKKIMKKLTATLFLIGVMVLAIGATLAKGQEVKTIEYKLDSDDTIALEWFSIDSYHMHDGNENLVIEFYYFEDFSQSLGQVMLDYNCETSLWYLDELTITEFTEDYIYRDAVIDSMAYIAYEIVTLYNNDMDYSAIFPEFQPWSLYSDTEISRDNRDMLSDVYNQPMTCNADLNFSLYMPIISTINE